MTERAFGVTGWRETCFLVLALLPKISFVTLDNFLSGLLLPHWKSQGLVWKMSKITSGSDNLTVSECIFPEPCCLAVDLCASVAPGNTKRILVNL